MPTLDDFRNRYDALTTPPSALDLTAGSAAILEYLNPHYRRAESFATPLDFHRARFGHSFIEGKHFELMNEKLVDLAERRIKQLLICMPPQHGKSQLAVSFEAWYMSKFPSHDIIGTSYSADHAKGFSGEIRDAIRDHSDTLGIHLDPSQHAREKWRLIEGALYSAMGLKGGITGKPSDLLLGDDPIKGWEEAQSETQRKKIINNWRAGAESRRKPRTVRLIIMTRWHPDDISTWAIENGFETLLLPAIATDDDDPLGRKRGEPLWPESGRDAAFYEEMRESVGEYLWACLFQQKPQSRPPDHEGLISFASVREACKVDNRMVDSSGEPSEYWKRLPADIGADIARSENGDRWSAMVVRGGSLVEQKVEQGKNLMAIVGELVKLAKKHTPRSIRIDDTGIGGGVTDRLVEVFGQPESPPALRSIEVIPVNFGQRAFEYDKYANWKAEAWDHLRKELREGKLELPEDSDLFDDLTAPQMAVNSSGRNALESKQAMKRRGVRSPDLGDALALACYPIEQFQRSEVW